MLEIVTIKLRNSGLNCVELGFAVDHACGAWSSLLAIPDIDRACL